MPKVKKPEILAPVGGEEQLAAAVRCGADAVYFGMSDFNARRSAANFSDEKLPGTIAFCHEAGTKVYITLNTLIKDCELSAMKKAVDTAARSGADALIIQDISVAEYAKRAWPDLALHASTQMAVSNSAGVLELISRGFSRVVLARELTLSEMAAIYEKTAAELEVFVHGAHCMSASGNCYISSMIGARSGNRGLCAQPCRLDWKCRGRDHCLSLKDMCYVPRIRELWDAGMTSFKIEGRMKRPEYVAAAVTAVKNALSDKPVDMDTLRDVFSRSGFTDGYLTGKRNSSMFGFRTKEDVTAAPAVFSGLRKLYEKDNPRVELCADFSCKKERPAELLVSDGEHTVKVFGGIPEAALTRPLSKESAYKNLSKTGGTPYFIGTFNADIDEGLSVSAADLNALRRNALFALSRERTALPETRIKCGDEAPRFGYINPPEKPAVRLRFEKAEQIFKGAFEREAVILPLSEIEKHKELLSEYPGKLWAELSDIMYEESLEKAEELLIKLRALGLSNAVCGNPGSLYLAKKLGICAHGGFCLNVINSEAASYSEKFGLFDICMSFETGFSDMRTLRSALPFGYAAYGYMPLMKFRSCPAKGEKGCGGCEGKAELCDRTKEKFTLLCRGREYSELFNCVPLYTADKSCPKSFFTLLYFTVESRSECQRITKLHEEGSPCDFRRTTGLYQRELL